jgi:hypothetical protein
LIWIKRAAFAEIYKRLNIENDKTMRTNSTENISNNQKAENAPRSREIFSRAYGFHRLHIEQQIQSRLLDKERRNMFNSLGKRKRHTLKIILWLTIIVVISLTKWPQERKERHDYDIYKNNHPDIPKLVVTVVDLEYLGIEKDSPGQLSSHYHSKRKETNTSCPKKKKSTTKFIPTKRGW